MSIESGETSQAGAPAGSGGGVPPAPPAPAAAATERDVQRGALRELVRLIQDCSLLEAQIQRVLAEALAAAAEQQQRSHQELSDRHAAQLEAIGQQAQDVGAKLDANVSQSRIQAKAADEMARRRIDGECQTVEQESKKELDKVVWLADSVLEATQNAARDEAGKQKDAHAERLDQIQQLRNRALKSMVEYGLADQVEGLESSAAISVVADQDLTVGGLVAQGVAAATQPSATKSPEPATKRFSAEMKSLERQVQGLGRLILPRVFVGATMYLLPACVAIIAALLVQVVSGGLPGNLASPDWHWQQMGIAGAVALVGTIVISLLLLQMGRGQVRRAYVPLHANVLAAGRAADDVVAEAEQARQARLVAAIAKREDEIAATRSKIMPVVLRARAKRDAAHEAQRAAAATQMAAIGAQEARSRADLQTRHADALAQANGNYERDMAAADQLHQSQADTARRTHDDDRDNLQRKWTDGLAHIRAPIGPRPGARPAGGNGNAPASGQASAAVPAPVAWDDPAWADWIPPRQFDTRVRFGTLHVDVKSLADDLARPRSRARAADDEFFAPNGDNGNGAAGDAPSPTSELVRGLASGASARAGGSIAADADEGPPPHQLTLPMPEDFSVPALLAFPRQASLLIQHDRAARPRAIATLQMAMARLLTTQPAGRVRFTIIDPVGLGQNFAGFMHLADFDETLVGTRIWTNAEQIEQRLSDLSEHMETVIQKYLRNEFPTIDDYNAQAGELAEPYRFLVIADYPNGFSPEACRKLASIAGTGARCGVYTLISRDRRMPMPQGAHIEDLEATSINLQPLPGVPAGSKPDAFVWEDDVFRRFPLRLDDPPAETGLTALLQRVGRYAKEANRVEVPFQTIAPPPAEFWSQDASQELRVPIGRTGATRLQTIRLGRGVAQHALVAGKTGSGKSTLLNAIITNVAMWYPPDQVELYLVDFKKGVEFKTYATHSLPHARAIAVESDREFGLSVLQRIDAELTRRGELFRKAAVQDLAAYRQTAGATTLPRTLLIIDEFQEFFSEDDKLAQDAAVLLDRLVRQGRAFGTHVLLGSQTIGGTSGLSRSTLGQMAVRIALQCTEADSQLILGDNNSAARLLSRPGEAIYNDAGGLVENNSPFQIAWLPDEQREGYLEQIVARKLPASVAGAEPVVFEGNVPADITRNKRLAAMLTGPRPDAAAIAAATLAPIAYLGDPVAIKEPTAVQFRRQSGSSLLIVGQQEEEAMALMVSTILSLTAQLPHDRLELNILDGSPADSLLAQWLPKLKNLLPRHALRLIEWRSTSDAITGLATELARRQEADERAAPASFLMIYGLQRYRMLRKQEEDFSFSPGGEAKPVDPSKHFTALLREGPALGIHTIAWCDTLASVERTVDRTTMREFDNRALFQMSANDSSALIDAPTANKLGPNRAVAYSEEKGTMEKFRPYGLPPAGWLAEACAAISRRWA